MKSSLKLTDALRQLASAYPLDCFEWTLPESCPIAIPSHESSGYAKNVFLKENLHRLISNDESLDSHYWTIQEWGGIGSFKKSERNSLRIKNFLAELGKGTLTRQSFECISSHSKVASFIDPDRYAIYDSRAIYTLNWLIFNCSDDLELFPQPAGRSSSLAKYDMQTIFRLTKRAFSYRSHKSAFHDYCKLMKDLSIEVFGPNSKPYEMEMLLFMIAPTWAVGDIEKSVSLVIAADA
jgi:hypothetical protein